MSCGDRFSGLAVVEDLADGATDQVLGARAVDDGPIVPLTYTTADAGWTITVPAKFLTDYASIPRPLWPLIPPRGPYNRAAIVHDVLYRHAPIDPRTGGRVTWAAADAVMREACANLCVRRTQRAAIWLGLRAGGWLTWRQYRSRERAAAVS